MQGHIVAVLHTDLSPDERVERLGRILSVTPYEARQHALVPPPRALASRPGAEEATALVDRLAAEGMPSAVFHQDAILADARRFVARALEVRDHGLAGARKDGAQVQLVWGDVTAIVVGLRNRLAFVDIVDERGGVFTARERETQFDASGLPVAGGRAGVLALAQHVRARSNGRFDDRLMKPVTLAQVCGPFASSPVADDLAESILLRSLLA
ncbi:MAG: hypothetical protein A2138_20650 [Deltaproteobacteria bacterium RBG_16_71_12]|nr:MAG: hypothetical protein A2138_20650 [Deltaproteobacteria bacterium RBG_16_71_12]